VNRVVAVVWARRFGLQRIIDGIEAFIAGASR
jgi:hypothetical protein